MDRPRRKTVAERMLELLRDGRPHRFPDLYALLEDDLAERSTVKVHVHAVRRMLTGSGLTVVCVSNGRGTSYRIVGIVDADAVNAAVPALACTLGVN